MAQWVGGSLHGRSDFRGISRGSHHMEVAVYMVAVEASMEEASSNAPSTCMEADVAYMSAEYSFYFNEQTNNAGICFLVFKHVGPATYT